MSKSLYIFGILLIGLGPICVILYGIVYFQLGGQISMLPSFIGWFFWVNTLSFIGSIFMLKYFHYKNYRFAFSVGVISTVVNLCFFVLVYRILTTHQLIGYYVPMRFICLCTGLVYAASLIFSDTRKNIWLKLAGIIVLCVILILLSITIRSFIVPPSQLNSKLETISQWVSMVGNLATVLYVINFFSELRLLKTQNETIPTSPTVTIILTIVVTLSFIFTFTFGASIVSESSSQVYWGKQNFEKTKLWAQTFETRMFVNGKGDTLFYRLQKPLNYDPQKKYPMVVSLPYGGQPGTNKIRQVEGAWAAVVLSEDDNRRKYPAFLFVPNCPPGSGWGGVPNYPSVDSLVYKAIEALDKELPIDVKRCYVTGISRGGYGSWQFICTRPDMFAAAIPVSGAGDPKLASKIINVPVWAFHGAQDINVPVSGSRDMINAIKKAGGHPRYTEYPDDGHVIWDKVSATPGLWDWLFAQQRN